MNKYNAEGYRDPTTFEALSRVATEEKRGKRRDPYTPRPYDMGYRPLVYICSPFAGDVQLNRKNARKYSRFALDQSAIPLTPHLLYPQFMDDKDPAERWLARHKINYVLVGKCDELWVFGSVISSGMEYEISVAKKRQMKIRYFTDELKEVRR